MFQSFKKITHILIAGITGILVGFAFFVIYLVEIFWQVIKLLITQFRTYKHQDQAFLPPLEN